MFSHEIDATIAGLFCAVMVALYATTGRPGLLVVAVGLAFVALRELALVVRDRDDGR